MTKKKSQNNQPAKPVLKENHESLSQDLKVETAIIPEEISVESKELIVINNENLPQTVPSEDISTFKQYIRDISKHPLLTREEEKELILKFRETGDIDIAKKLVLSNLRLVVKIAMEYKSAWQNIMDLIQEGNIGLMKAVSKYDNTKGAKLSYYASWWIKSYILKYILDNFRLVKIGTTNEQKKLFYNLMKEKNRLISLGINPDTKKISQSLGVSEKSVELMEKRLSGDGEELSLDAPIKKSGESSARLGEVIPLGEASSPEEQYSQNQELNLLKSHMGDFLKTLKERDLEIFKDRLLNETPKSLQEIGDFYGISRERVRQIEARLLKNLKLYMSQYIR
ncbi:MAG: RNA polymerase subunit sigma-70 [Halobacteriovoraceae bacterium]|nr:RNA polymerase subunit sigma-70 [Halobacteriovoraceae bacterium]|tara:strand:+ start:367 stop:1383 length:1017 start_codon:yes stop_codon:yes gene_type:complete